MGALQQLFREHGAGYLARFGDSMPNNHRKVIGAIERCRSEQAGHTLYHCQACGKSHVIARSCGNRHCPGCQHHKTQAWLQCQLQRQLPGAHFMLTFTVPASLREFVRSHQRAGYAALFEASAGAIKKLAADPRYLGGDLAGFLGVLHTWGRQLQYHPHIHYLVPGGAISSTDRQWHASSAGFYLPVRALSKIFRAKFRDAMAAQGLLAAIPAEAWDIDWNVNCQPVGDGQASLAYLARYVFKVAISERRIVSIDEHAVTFRYRKVHSNRARTMRLPIAEFLRRFLQHVLPTGFMKVRYYGFLSPSCSVPIEELKARIAMAHGFAQQPPPIEIEPPTPMRCPHCGGSLRFVRSMGMAKPQRSLAAASVGAPHSGP
ncbi:MAG: transposase [Acidobacteria bacterium RIFCSPLOWO2_02_FULL_59_13]|nr:MAG: transposase [Acidobacteria bacterium RIFCSPLOWO2_02_FULL_59_13]